MATPMPRVEPPVIARLTQWQTWRRLSAGVPSGPVGTRADAVAPGRKGVEWRLDSTLPAESLAESLRHMPDCEQMSTRRTKSGGWVKQRRRGTCRWCGKDVPKGRFTFCGDACVEEWKLRTDPGYLRERVFERDRGVCAICGVDTEALRKNKRKLDYAARRQFEKDWGARRSLWDADHVTPVVEGGGECGLANMRTLCLKCHRAATAELRRRLGRPTGPTATG